MLEALPSPKACREYFDAYMGVGKSLARAAAPFIASCVHFYSFKPLTEDPLNFAVGRGPAARLKSAERGVVRQYDEDRLRRLLAAIAGRRPAIVIVESGVRRSQPAARKLEPPLLYCGEEIYHATASMDDLDVNELERVVEYASMGIPAIGVLARNAAAIAEAVNAKEDVTEGFWRTVAASIELGFMCAYDGESFVVAAKSRLAEDSDEAR